MFQKIINIFVYIFSVLHQFRQIKQISQEKLVRKARNPMKYTSFNALVAPYANSSEIQKMNEYMAHGRTNVYEHSYLVARLSYKICTILPIKLDIHSVVAGAMLHDFYLYDWHKLDPKHKWHGKVHGYTAYQNATQYFIINNKTKNIIEAHMWPKNFKEKPKSTEAIVVSVADKIQASIEMISRRKTRVPIPRI